MKAYCDLHIHSCLSPCASDDMTPWNLVGMAKVKGLDVIALTDHNSALNMPAAMAAAQHYGVELLPGMEVTSREEVHMLVYFADAAQAVLFGAYINEHLPAIQNNPKLFGNQIVVGIDDEPAGVAPKLLLTATDLSVDDIVRQAPLFKGVCVPAHINRGSNGMIGALGFLPKLPDFPVVEVSKNLPCSKEALEGRTVLYSSDAHRLEDIAEREFELDVEPVTAQTVWERLFQLVKG